MHFLIMKQALFLQEILIMMITGDILIIHFTASQTPVSRIRFFSSNIRGEPKAQ